MAAYCRVYGFGHLRLTAEDRDQLRNPTLALSMGVGLPLLLPGYDVMTINVI